MPIVSIRVSSDSSPTLHETNMFAPENGWLEYDCFRPGLFSGAKMLVLGSVGE